MAGRLMLLVGNSGSGKDSLLSFLKTEAGPELRLVYPPRWITRDQPDQNETYRPVTLSEFARKIKAGEFFVWWEAYEYLYGIDQQVETQLRAGYNAVLNISRNAVAELRRRYPLLTVIQVEVSPETVTDRLKRRGRGGAAELQKRLDRAVAFQNYHEWDVRFRNEGDLQQNGRKFTALVSEIIAKHHGKEGLKNDYPASASRRS